jgi:hypothetical protein
MDWNERLPDPTIPLTLIPLARRLRTRGGQHALPVSPYALRVVRWPFTPVSSAEGGLLIVQGRQADRPWDEDDWQYSWRFIVPGPSQWAVVDLWHALAHIFRRLGMPVQVQLPFSRTIIDPWEYMVILSLAIYDWHRPPPSITYASDPRPALPIQHSRTLAGAMERDARLGLTRHGYPFAACFPAGYLTNAAALPGPPMPPPFHPGMSFTAWIPVEFEGPFDEVAQEPSQNNNHG